jgi:hypothetical protein
MLMSPFSILLLSLAQAENFPDRVESVVLQMRNLSSIGLVIPAWISDHVSESHLLIPASWGRVDSVSLLPIEKVGRSVHKTIQVVEEPQGAIGLSRSRL